MLNTDSIITWNVNGTCYRHSVNTELNKINNLHEGLVQLELFEKTFEEETECNIKNIELRLDNLRKGLFKRHTGLSNNVTILQNKIEELQMQISMLDRYIKSIK